MQRSIHCCSCRVKSAWYRHIGDDASPCSISVLWLSSACVSWTHEGEGEEEEDAPGRVYRRPRLCTVSETCDASLKSVHTVSPLFKDNFWAREGGETHRDDKAESPRHCVRSLCTRARVCCSRRCVRRIRYSPDSVTASVRESHGLHRAAARTPCSARRRCVACGDNGGDGGVLSRDKDKLTARDSDTPRPSSPPCCRQLHTNCRSAEAKRSEASTE